MTGATIHWRGTPPPWPRFWPLVRPRDPPAAPPVPDQLLRHLTDDRDAARARVERFTAELAVVDGWCWRWSHGDLEAVEWGGEGVVGHLAAGGGDVVVPGVA